MRLPVCLGLLALLGVTAALAQGSEARLLVQSSPLAGFRHHEAKALWNDMRVGDQLALVREPANPYDANAVRVEWQGHKLGYVPRVQNADVARQLDLGVPLAARISKFTKSRAPNKRIEFEVYAPL